MSSQQKLLLITRFPYESILSGEEWHTITLSEELIKRGWTVAFLGSCNVLVQEFLRRKIMVRRMPRFAVPVSLWHLIGFFFLWPVQLVWMGLEVIHIQRYYGKKPSVMMLSLGEKIVLTPLLLLWKIPVVWMEHQRLGAWIYKNPLRWFYEKWPDFYLFQLGEDL